MEGPAVVLHSSWCGFALPSCPQSFSQHHCWGLPQCLTHELRFPHGKQDKGILFPERGVQERCRSRSSAGRPVLPHAEAGGLGEACDRPPASPADTLAEQGAFGRDRGHPWEAARALSQKPRPPVSPARAPGARKQGGGGHKWLHSPPPPVTHRETVCSSSPNIGPFGMVPLNRKYCPGRAL